MKALEIPAYSESNSVITYYTGDKNKNALTGSPKLLLYKDTKVFLGLTSSRSYDIIGLVQTRLALLGEPHSFQDAVDFILGAVGLEAEQVKRIDKPHICHWQEALEPFIRFKSTGSALKPYDKSILDQLDKVYPQSWIDEGISIDTMDKYRIGWYDRLQATTIPCFNTEGEMIGLRGRFWADEDVVNGKYKPITLLDGTTYKFPTSEVFYGINFNAPEIERTGVAMLVEGEKSVMKLDTMYGEKNVGLAMYGKNLGSRRRNQLVKLGCNKVILIADNDWIGKPQEAYDEWEKQIIQFGKQFKGYCSVDVVWDNLGLLKPKDNALDAGEEVWKKLYKNREILV